MKTKANAYPLRLDADIEQAISELLRTIPLSKADILRMSLKTGFNAIDWKAFASPPLKGGSAVLNETGAPYKAPSAGSKNRLKT